MRPLLYLTFCIAFLPGTFAQVVQHIYDSKQQLIEVQYEDGTTIQYCYDELGNRTCANVTPNTVLSTDLALSGQNSSPVLVCQAATLSLAWQVDNLGNGSTGGFNTRIVLSTDTIYDAGIDPLVGTRYSSGLAAGAMQNLSETIALPPGTLPGSYYLLIYADAEQLISELSEQNNLVRTALTVSSNAGFITNLSTIDATCGQNDGSATATPVGGTAPFSYLWSTVPAQNGSTAIGLSSGPYFVTIADTEGCETSELVLIENSQSDPAPAFIYTIQSDTVSFTNTTPNGDSYSWDFGDGNSSTEVDPLHLYQSTGVYTICLSATNSCGTNTFCQVLDTDAAGVAGTCPTETLVDTMSTFQAIYSSYLGGRGLKTLPLSDGGVLTILDLNGDGPLYYGDMGLMKTDGDGRLIWAKAFTDSLLAQITDILELDNGHFLFCGYGDNFGVGNSDGLLGELSPCGDVLWVRTYGGPQLERLYSLDLGDPGEVIAVGRTASYGSGQDDVFLLKTDLSGNVIWAKAYGGSNDDDGRSVVTGHQLAAAKFIVAGNTQSFPAGYAEDHILCFSVDTDGNVYVVKALGDTYDQGSLYADEIREYLLPPFNSYFYTISGHTYDDDIFIGGLTDQAQNGFITTVNLNILPSYARMINGTRIQGLTTIPGQGYAACGQSRIMRFNNDLSTQWMTNYGGMNAENFYGIALADNGSFYATGFTSSFPNYSAHLLEVDSAGTSGCFESAGNLENVDVEQWVDAHNPTGGQFQVTDISGFLSVTQPALAFNDLIMSHKWLCPTSICEIELDIADTLIRACQGSQLQHNATVEYAESLRWYLNDSLIGGGASISYLYDSVGTYVLRALADNSLCTKADSVIVVIDTFDTDVALDAALSHAADFAANDGAIDLTVLHNPGPFQYHWSTGDTTQDLQQLPAGSYQVTLTYNTSCTYTDQFQLQEYPDIHPDSLPLFNLNYPNANLQYTQVKRMDSTSYLLVGHSYNAISFIKLNLLGQVIWDRTHFINLIPKSVHVLPDGSFYVVNEGTLILAADPEGNIRWAKNFPSSIKLQDVSAFSTGEAVLTGFIDSSPATNGQKFAWFGKLDLQGNLLWHNSLGANYDPNFGEHVRVHNDKAYILGTTDSWGDAFSWLSDLLMIRVSSNGSIDWIRTTGMRESGDRSEDTALDFEILSNGQFAVLIKHSTYNFSIFRSNSGFSNSYWINTYNEYQRSLEGIVVNQQDEPAVIGGKFWNTSTPRSQLIAQLDYNGNLNWSHYFDLGPNAFLYESDLDADNAYLLPVGSTHFARVDENGQSSCGYVDNTANFNVVDDFFPYTVHDDVYNALYYAPTITLTDATSLELGFNTDRLIACPTCEVGTAFQLSDTLPCANDTVWFFPATDTLEAYYWLVDGRLTSRQDTFIHVFEEVRDYSIDLIGRVGACLDTSSYTLTVGNAAIALLSQDSLKRCMGATLHAGTAGLQYLWSNGDTTRQTFVSNTGTYQLVATDSLGCPYVDSIYFEATNSLQVEVLAEDVSCNATADGQIELTIQQATPPIQIDWNTGASGPILADIPGAYYEATIQDSLGCQDSVALTINPSPSILLIPEDINCSNLNTGSLSAIVNGGAAPYHYQWSTGSNSTQIQALGPGIYSLEVIDNSGCLLTAATTLGNAPLLAYPDTTLCPGDGIALLVADQPAAALQLDGIQAYAQVPNHPDLQLNSNLSIECWVRPAHFAGPQPILHKAYGGEGAIQLETSGVVTFFWGTSGSNAPPFNVFSSTTPLTANTWNHIALVRDQSNNELHWYLNGVLDATLSGAATTSAISTQDWLIGAGPAVTFAGSLDEIRIWNSPLAGATIADWQAQTVSSLHPDYANLKAYWSFEEGQGTLAGDHSGNGHTAQLLQNAQWSTQTPGLLNANLLWSTGAIGDSIFVSPAATTSYSVTFLSSTGACADQITVDVYPALPDTDSDGTGDFCDEDDDNDGIPDLLDNCPLEANTNQADSDSDGIGNKCDNCRSTPNPDQLDSDNDGDGDACDNCPLDPENDIDGDGICAENDNCPYFTNANQADRDNDGVGNKCDNCKRTPNPDQIDEDNDGKGNACDVCPLDPLDDIDEDGICADQDNCPFDKNGAQNDTDGDGVGNKCDNCRFLANPAQTDADADGFGDGCDNCPNTPNPDQADADNNGIGDACELLIPNQQQSREEVLPAPPTPYLSYLPNPVSDKVQVQLHHFPKTGTYDIALLHLTGSVHWARQGVELTQQAVEIDLRELNTAPGIYLIRVICQGKLYVQRISVL